MGKCDPEVYKDGVSIGVIAGGSAKIIEFIVKEIAEDSGQKVDWHYIGGRANVLCVGDLEKAKQSFRLKKLQYLDR